jgi:excisionase family DNA binding protein
VKQPTPAPTTDDPILLRVSDVAGLLKTGRTTVFRLLATGELPRVRIGAATRVPKASVEKFVADRVAAADRRA